MHLLRNKVVKCDLFRFFPLEATAEMAMGGGFRRNTDRTWRAFEFEGAA